MGEKRRVDPDSVLQFDQGQNDYLKWLPVFQHLGLKPRRFVAGGDAVYICTAEGWFRLSMHKYQKDELNWLRSIMEYLEERSFKNWAVAWQQTVIWEESNCCYLIQPWIFGQERFHPGDPAALERIGEVLAELYRCGKDYRENRGLEVFRDRWSGIVTGWKDELSRLQNLKEDSEHEKTRKEYNGLRKNAEALLAECISAWESGMNSLFEHHYQLGVVGHGNLLAKYIVWSGNDYFLLNWEQLAFQPKIADLASLINDIAIWEPEWIIYFINQYSRIQPLWPEEYHALKALLAYPENLIHLLRNEAGKEIDYKELKEADKELKRKGRCLDKVWRELGAEHTRWAGGKEYILPKHRESGKLSMVLSPAESWGDGSIRNQMDSLIHVDPEEHLPTEIWRRLVNAEPDRVLGGREGSIMEAAAKVQPEPGSELEIAEEPVRAVTEEVEVITDNGPVAAQPEITPVKEQTEEVEKVGQVEQSEPVPVESKLKPNMNTVLNWSGFPKPMKRGDGR